MFGETWEWAGQFRQTGKTIGVSAVAIPESLKNLLGARFHHRLVQIHPFPNGNGRHGRLMTDALLKELGSAPFTWGSANLDALGTARATYIPALRRADEGDYTQLMAFVRT